MSFNKNSFLQLGVMCRHEESHITNLFRESYDLLWYGTNATLKLNQVFLVLQLFWIHVNHIFFCFSDR